MSAFIHLGIVIATFVTLAYSADRFVAAAGALALRLGMSMVLVGLIIVGFGTSAPEILVSAIAAMSDNTGIAIGNAIGSNIANIALILGVSAVIAPIVIATALIRAELVALLAATALVIPLALNGHLGRLDGAVMIGALMGLLAWLVLRARTTVPDPDGTAAQSPGGLARTIAWLIISLSILLVSAHLLVLSASELARLAGVGDLVIGLSIVALGTSLPELATSIAAVRQRQFAMAVGNILGSNLFNLLAVLGLAVLIRPTALDTATLLRDMGMMTVLTALLAVLLLGPGRIGRIVAVCMIVGYAGYQAMLFFHPLD